MRIQGIEIPEEAIAEFCRDHFICRLSIFGSVLRQDFRPDSDLDVLVEFEPGRTPGLIVFSGLALALERLIGRRIDLRTPMDLSPYFREQVLKGARVLHAA